MDDATIRKYASRVQWWVDDTTNVARVKVDDYVTSIFYPVPSPEMNLYDPPSPVSEYRKIPGGLAEWQWYRFFPLDGPAVVLRLAFGREINTVFVKE